MTASHLYKSELGIILIFIFGNIKLMEFAIPNG